MLLKVRIGNAIYKFNSDDYSLLKNLIENQLITSDKIINIDNFNSFIKNREKVLVYDYLGAKPDIYVDLIKYEDLSFYKDSGLDNVVEFILWREELKSILNYINKYKKNSGINHIKYLFPEDIDLAIKSSIWLETQENIYYDTKIGMKNNLIKNEYEKFIHNYRYFLND